MAEKVPKRPVKCNTCGRQFDSAMPENKIKCHCGSMDVSVIPPEELGEEESPKEAIPKPSIRVKPTAAIRLPKIIELSPPVLAQVDRLVNQKGMFPDMKDCVNKAVEMMVTQIENPKYIDYIMGGVKMSEEEPNPEKEIKKIQSQDIIEAHIAKKKAEADALLNKVNEGKATKSELLSVMRDRFEMKQLQQMMDELDGGKEGKGDTLKSLERMWMTKMYMEMMSNKMTGTGGGNGESLQLQKKIEDLQREIDRQKTLDAIKKIAETNKNKGMETEDYLKLFADKLAAVEKEKLETDKARHEAQQERDKRIEEINKRNLEDTERRIGELQQHLEEKKKEGSGIEELTKIRGHISTLKDLAKEFGDHEKEKTTGEIASELVLGIAEKLKEPISHAARGFADKQAIERMRVQGPVYTNYPGNPGPPVHQPSPEISSEVHYPQYSPQSSEVHSSEDDIVNTFSAQNTTKKSST